MTFSRPRIGPTDAMGRITRPNDQRGVDRVYVPEVNNARFTDNRNPSVIRAAGEADAARIGQFMQGISKLVDTGVEVIEKKLDTSQLEQVMAKPETADAIRKWDKESRDMFAGLRPNVRDQIGDMSAQLKFSNYGDRLSVEVLKEPSLYLGKPEGQTEEEYRKQKALARKDLYDRVAKETGIDQIEPRFLARHIARKTAAEAAVYGIEEKERYSRDAEKRNNILNQAVIESFRYNFDANRSAEAAANDPKATPEQRQAAQAQFNFSKTDQYKNTLLNDWWTRANELGIKPNEFAAAIFAQVNNLISSKTIAGNPQSTEETQRMMKDLGELFNGKFLIPGINVDLMSIPVTQGGLALPAAIQEMQNRNYPVVKQARADEQFKNLVPYILRAAQGDTGSQVAIINLIKANANNPNFDFKQSIAVLDSVRGLLRQPTQSQEMNFAGIVAEMNNPNADRATLNQKISEYANSGKLQWDQAARLFGQNQERNKPGGNREGRIHNAMQESSPLFDNITRQWATELGRKGLAPDKQSVKAFEDEVAMTALLNTKKIVDAKTQSTGKELTDDEIRVTLRNEIDVIRKNRLKDARQDGNKFESFNDKTFNMIQDIQQNIKDGKRDVQVFTPEFVQQFRQVNPDQRANYTNLNKYVIKVMGQIDGEKDGKTVKVYSNPQEEWRKWFDESKRTQQQQQGQPSRSMPPLQKASIEQGSPDFLQALNNVMPRLGMTALDIATGSSSASAGEMPVKSAPVKPGTTVPNQPQTQQAPQPQQKKQDLGSEIFTRGIAAAAGVSETVLKTRTPLDLVVNANSLDALSRLFKKREAMTMETPKLPQTVASAPTTPAPLAISNDRHPMFVLIGLNEGTRTLDGGYTQAYYGHTDPGNGVRNVGTVSGQQGGTPQQSDRRWAGILTGVATQVAPYMAKLGLLESTVGYQRILFNVLDLYVQAPKAVPDFVKKIQQVIASGMSIEAIAKARADSFFNPATGRLDASGFGNSYSRLLADQRARAGTWDYKRRL